MSFEMNKLFTVFVIIVRNWKRDKLYYFIKGQEAVGFWNHACELKQGTGLFGRRGARGEEAGLSLLCCFLIPMPWSLDKSS
jgi:hypothetical protein